MTFLAVCAVAVAIVAVIRLAVLSWDMDGVLFRLDCLEIDVRELKKPIAVNVPQMSWHVPPGMYTSTTLTPEGAAIEMRSHTLDAESTSALQADAASLTRPAKMKRARKAKR